MMKRRLSWHLRISVSSLNMFSMDMSILEDLIGQDQASYDKASYDKASYDLASYYSHAQQYAAAAQQSPSDRSSLTSRKVQAHKFSP